MRRDHKRGWANAVCMVWLFVQSLALAPAAGAQTSRVGVASDGSQADFAIESTAEVSADGRYVVFESLASNLVPGDTNNVSDIFLRDRQTGVTTRLNIAADGTQADSWSHRPSISDDGRYVAFISQASNLVPGVGDSCTGGPSYCPRAYLLDRRLGELTHVSLTGSRVAITYSVRLSGNGRVLVFSAYNGAYLRDLDSGELTALGYTMPSLSADGRFLAFPSTFSSTQTDNLGETCADPGTRASLGTFPIGPFMDVCLYDRVTKTVQKVSTLPGVDQKTLGGSGPSISADGRFVVFRALRDGGGLQADEELGIYVWEQGAPSAVPLVPSGGVPSTFTDPLISADGRFAAFSSNDSALPGVATAGGPTLAYVANTQTREVRLSSVAGLDTLPAGGEGYIGNTATDISADGRFALFHSTASNLVPGDTNQCGQAPSAPGTCADLFLRDMFDDDGDTMTNDWERFFGFDPRSPTDATLDSDADGSSSAQEFAAGTHPRGVASATRYFAEGASTALFDTRIALANPSASIPASVLMRFVRPDGTFATQLVMVPPMRSHHVLVDAVAAVGTSAFSTVVESDVPVVADRVTWWGTNGASSAHAERSLSGPALSWHFAEGATHSGFELFYLLLNNTPTPSSVRVRYLRPGAAPLERTYIVPANSRFNIWVDQQLFAGELALANTDVATVFEVLNGVPLLVERAMYLSPPGGAALGAGHASAGATALSDTWLLAEGATGDYFDEFVLVANPGSSATSIRATYLLTSGASYQKTYVVAGESRLTIWVDEETIPGHGRVLSNEALSVRLDVLSGPSVVAERSMWWPGPTAASWYGAHNVVGTSAASPRWGFAEGAVSSAPASTNSYFLIANTSSASASVRVTLLFPDGAPLSRTWTVPPTSRFNVSVRDAFPDAVDRLFGAIVESVDPISVPLVVERAVYNDAEGVRWAAGTAALGTPLP